MSKSASKFDRVLSVVSPLVAAIVGVACLISQ